MDVDVDKVSGLIVECAKEYILPRFKMLKDHEVRTKSGPNDLVTQADIDVENRLKKELPALLAGSIVIGEEGVSSGEASLAPLKDADAAIWVVDPVDGTNNFAHGKREFGVMLALVRKGRTEVGWIYDVLGEEMSVARLGQGAYAGGKKMKVSEPKDMTQLSGHMSFKFFPREYVAELKETRKEFKSAMPLFCAAHEYLNISNGRADFSLYSRLKPWDHLAGALMVQEAGGYVVKWDGSPYTPADEGGGLISACNKEVWEMVYETVLKPLPSFRASSA